MAIGVALGDLEHGSLEAVSHPNACFLTTSGKIFGGKARIETSFFNLKLPGWLRDDSSFGPPLRVRETIGCGWNSLRGQLFFTRFVGGKMVTCFVEGFDPMDQQMWPALVLTGAGTIIKSNFNANPLQTHRKIPSVSKLAEKRVKVEHSGSTPSKKARVEKEEVIAVTEKASEKNDTEQEDNNDKEKERH